MTTTECPKKAKMSLESFTTGGASINIFLSSCRQKFDWNLNWLQVQIFETSTNIFFHLRRFLSQFSSSEVGFKFLDDLQLQLVLESEKPLIWQASEVFQNTWK